MTKTKRNLGKVVILNLKFLEDNVFGLKDIDFARKLYATYSRYNKINYVVIDKSISSDQGFTENLLMFFGLVVCFSTIEELRMSYEYKIYEDWRCK